MIILFYVCVGLWNACVFAVCGFDARRQIREAIARSIDREDEEEGGADVARRDDREREMLATFGLLDEERLYHCGVFRQSYAYHLQLENILNVTIVTQLLLVNDAVLPNSAFFKFPVLLVSCFLTSSVSIGFLSKYEAKVEKAKTASSRRWKLKLKWPSS